MDCSEVDVTDTASGKEEHTMAIDDPMAHNPAGAPTLSSKTVADTSETGDSNQGHDQNGINKEDTTNGVETETTTALIAKRKMEESEGNMTTETTATTKKAKLLDSLATTSTPPTAMVHEKKSDDLIVSKATKSISTAANANVEANNGSIPSSTQISDTVQQLSSSTTDTEKNNGHETVKDHLSIKMQDKAENHDPKSLPVHNDSVSSNPSSSIKEDTDATQKSNPAGEKSEGSGDPTTIQDSEKSKKDTNGSGKTTQEVEGEDANDMDWVNASADDIVSHYKTLPVLASRPRPLKALSNTERFELERLFGIDKGTNKWDDDDWVGVVALVDEEVPNPDGRAAERARLKSLLTWAENGKKSLKLLYNLIRHVYNHKKIPKQAKKILANADPKSLQNLTEAITRLSMDPLVLRQDGWTTAKSSEPEGASGGAYRIGEKVIWQGQVGVVIAYVHDTHMGDLWKAMWIEDLSTFDLELEELEDARKKYLKKNQPKSSSGEKKVSASSSLDSARRSVRNVSTADFQVEGIEHGIVLATSYARGARHGVFWPARVMHASELRGSQSKRLNRQKVDVVFLAPYWNSDPLAAVGRRNESFSDSIARHGEALFSSGPLFEVESADANDECIQRYPYDADTGLDIDELRSSFKFSGLPKAAFPRFLDSHRLALALRTYSQNELKSTIASDIDRTSAGLLEGHPLSALTANFPSAVLHLPFNYILSQLPHPEQEISPIPYADQIANGEPSLQLGRILDAMKPPVSWGLGEISASGIVKESPGGILNTPAMFDSMNKGSMDGPSTANEFINGLPSLQSLLSENSPAATILKNSLTGLLSCIPGSASQQLQNAEKKRKLTRAVYKTWVVVKSQGEELISALGQEKAVKEWRRCCERVYKHILVDCAEKEGEAGVSWIITDSRCNLHLTSSECFERPVRLPAAMKGVKQAAGNIHIVDSVSDKYLELAERDIILRAHKKSYIQRIKKRCLAATSESVVALTEDSDGNGGEDTKGSKGSWKAAVAAVGAALQGADVIMHGECLNAFCPTRPPGHHAGRELHAMKAVSNGFCVLNAVACAALYATAPISEGGLGLSRVCVIDFDVHHGNGTQDILCSTYDPRFLYVSIHAGGSDVNGVDLGEIGEQMGHHLGRNPKKGIFPGRCGDLSPHAGVLNIPLGGRVTSHALGTALITKVSPAVDKFAPELIIVSAGFDAHKNDPLNLGALTSDDFGTLTEIICKLAFKSCSGRVLSVMEGGYGVPCCRPQNFPPEEGERKEQTPEDTTASLVAEERKEDADLDSNQEGMKGSQPVASTQAAPNLDLGPPLQCLDLGEDMPADMPDVVASYALQKRLDRCHAEGFIHCVKEHVSALARCNVPK